MRDNLNVRRKVAKCFLDPIVVYHEGGHFIPLNGEIKERIYQFLLPFTECSVCFFPCVALNTESLASCGTLPRTIISFNPSFN